MRVGFQPGQGKLKLSFSTFPQSFHHRLVYHSLIPTLRTMENFVLLHLMGTSGELISRMEYQTALASLATFRTVYWDPVVLFCFDLSARFLETFMRSLI